GHELLDVLVHHRVVRDAVDPGLLLGPGRQLALQEQVGRLQERALLRELLDRVAAVVEDALVPVDERDAALAGGGVGESRVVGHETGVVAGLDLTEVERFDGPVLDGDLVGLAGAVVGDGQGVLAHASASGGAAGRAAASEASTRWRGRSTSAALSRGRDGWQVARG